MHRPVTDITPQQAAENPIEADAPCIFPWADPVSGNEYQGCLWDAERTWCPTKLRNGQFAGKEVNYYGICHKGINTCFYSQ